MSTTHRRATPQSGPQRPLPAVLLVAAAAAGCGSRGAAPPGEGSAPPPSCLEGQATLPDPSGEAILWAESAGIVEGAPDATATPAGYVEADAADRSLWLGALRERGGDVYLRSGGTDRAQCRRFRLEAETRDHGWLATAISLGDGSAGRRLIRYSFRQATTGFIDETRPDRSRTVTQVFWNLDGALTKAPSPAGGERLVGADRCRDSLRVVAADEHRLLVVPGSGTGAVRAYPREAALPVYLSAAECERMVESPRGEAIRPTPRRRARAPRRASARPPR